MKNNVKYDVQYLPLSIMYWQHPFTLKLIFN